MELAFTPTNGSVDLAGRVGKDEILYMLLELTVAHSEFGLYDFSVVSFLPFGCGSIYQVLTFVGNPFPAVFLRGISIAVTTVI